MSYFYDPKEKKSYKVLGFLEGTKDPNVKNPSLYVQTRPGYHKRVSAIRVKGFKEAPADKEWNDNVFKALFHFKKEKGFK